MDSISNIKDNLGNYTDPIKAQFHTKFFRAFPGGYGAGDIFIGITVPNMRKVAKQYFNECNLEQIDFLLKESIHEYRLTALFILVYKFEKAKLENERKSIVDLYISNLESINNWDLVDASSYKILGPYLYNKPKDILYDFAKSNSLWTQRISIITTLYFIKKDRFEETLKLAEILMHHEHDLIHKAVGWMLREVGKRNYQVEYDFLKKHYQYMPRTMLRYAIEKFEEGVRQQFLKGTIQ